MTKVVIARTHFSLIRMVFNAKPETWLALRVAMAKATSRSASNRGMVPRPPMWMTTEVEFRLLTESVFFDHSSGWGIAPTAMDMALVLVKRIVSQYGGSVEVSESPLGGFRIRTTWPTESGVLANEVG